MLNPHYFSGTMSYSSNYERELEQRVRDWAVLDSEDVFDDGLDARIIAGWLHDGQFSALYAFASSGTLMSRAIMRELSGDDSDAATALRDWVERCEDVKADTRCDGQGTGIASGGYYSCHGCPECEEDDEA